MVFYAYAKNINDDWSYRYVIVFADRDTATGWWRAVSSAAGTPYPSSVKRINYQYFTHNPAIANMAFSITDPKVASDHLGTVFFTLLNDRDGRILSLIPEQDMSETVSGSTYYIRSLNDPSLYWFVVGNQGDVYGSRNDRTRFRIHLSNQDLPKGTPIIGTGDVYISLASDDSSYVSMEPSGKLVIGTTQQVYKFRDLQQEFVVRDEQSRAYIYKTDGGEEWELV